LMFLYFLPPAATEGATCKGELDRRLSAGADRTGLAPQG